jgi:hypothetical protein
MSKKTRGRSGAVLVAVYVKHIDRTILLCPSAMAAIENYGGEVYKVTSESTEKWEAVIDR